MATLRGRQEGKHQHIYRKVPEISLTFRKTMRTANKLQSQLKIHLHESSHHTEFDPAKPVVTPMETHSFYFCKDTCCCKCRALDYTCHCTDWSSLLSWHSFIGWSLFHTAIICLKKLRTVTPPVTHSGWTTESFNKLDSLSPQKQKDQCYTAFSNKKSTAWENLASHLSYFSRCPAILQATERYRQKLIVLY